MAKDSISGRKKKAYQAICISIFITAVIVLLKLEMARTEGKLTLLVLTLSPYGFLTLVASCTSKKRALQNVLALRLRKLHHWINYLYNSLSIKPNRRCRRRIDGGTDLLLRYICSIFISCSVFNIARHKYISEKQVTSKD